jgi:thioredoxin-like negative regulator of GroEL
MDIHLTHDIISRILASVIIISVFVLAVKSYGTFTRMRVRTRYRKKQSALLFKTGSPVLIYFWASHCAQCKPQERQIEQAQALLQRSGRTLKVHKFNALEEQKLAKTMNVLTVPTTVMLNSKGNVTTWNPGLTQADAIIKQFLALQ